MKSSVIKRSVVINRHKTSISLEDQFWTSVRDIAQERHQSVGQLIANIDTERGHANLSSAIRLFVLEFYRQQLRVSERIRSEFFDQPHVQ